MLNVGIPLDLAGLFTGPDGIPVLERILSSTPDTDFPRSQFQLEWPTTNLQFCHDDGSDPSSGWRAHLPDLRLIDGRNDGSAADLCPDSRGPLRSPKTKPSPAPPGYARLEDPTSGPETMDAWPLTVKQSICCVLGGLREETPAPNGGLPRNLPPKAMSALDTPYRARPACFGKAATACCSENAMAGRTLVSTTTLARNQRLGLTTEESAPLQRTFGADAVTPSLLQDFIWTSNFVSCNRQRVP